MREIKYNKLTTLLERYPTYVEVIKLKYFALLKQLTEAPDLDTQTFLNNVKRINEMGCIIVCYIENPLSDEFNIIGSGTIIIEPKLIRGGKCVGHIEDIVTNANYRGKGIGKDTLDLLIQEGREKNCYKIILDCVENLETFYCKNGFEKKGLQMALYF